MADGIDGSVGVKQSSSPDRQIDNSLMGDGTYRQRVDAVATTAALAALSKVEDAAHVTGDKGTMPLAVRNDAGTALADTDLDYIPITTDSLGNEFVTQGTLIEGEDSTNRVLATSNKPTPVSTYAWSVDISAALEASSIVKATAGVLRSIDGRIDASAPTATYFLDVMNSATLPADGAVTELWSPKKIVHTTGTDSNFSIDFTMNGIYASAGIVVCLSSTEDTKTITAAYLRMSILYV